MHLRNGKRVTLIFVAPPPAPERPTISRNNGKTKKETFLRRLQRKDECEQDGGRHGGQREKQRAPQEEGEGGGSRRRLEEAR